MWIIFKPSNSARMDVKRLSGFDPRDSMLLYIYTSCTTFSQFDWLIIGQDGGSAAKNVNCKNWLKNSRKTSKTYKTRENAFDKTRERLFFAKFSVSFLTISVKIENKQKTLENDLGLTSWKITFWKFVGKFSVNIRNTLVLAENKILINRIASAVPWNSKSSSFTHRTRKLDPYFKTSDLVFHDTALAPG